MSRLEEIKKMLEKYYDSEDSFEQTDLAIAIIQGHAGHLIQQTERVRELENRNKELEYASMHNGELNEFLQKRKLPPNTLGRHVVDVVMKHVEELESEKEQYKLWFHRQKDKTVELHHQAERVAELEKENKKQNDVISKYYKRLNKFKRDERRHRQALEDIKEFVNSERFETIWDCYSINKIINETIKERVK